MNRIGPIALFVGATLMSVGSAAAQGSAFEVNVPFNFTVNNTFLPAGSYNVSLDLMHPNALVIRDRTKCVKATDFGQRGTVGAGSPRTLIFHHYGDQYFLSEVRFESARNGIFLPAIKSERQARKVGQQGNLTFAKGTVAQGPGNSNVEVSGVGSF